jgi:signal transduction histidine kinase
MHEIEGRLRTAIAELQSATHVAQAADRAKSEFLATMSHELRTPLNAIIGFAEIMSTQLLGPIGSPAYRSYADDIMRSGHHLLALINDILDFAKVDAGKLALEEETIDLRKVGESAIRLLGQQAQAAGVTLPMRTASAPVMVRADGRRLRQVCLNLIGNAIKFTPEGGRVEVKVSVEGGEARLEVRDTGVGIRPEDLPHVIEPFRQANQGHARRHAGTGLGLSISDRLVRLHGGRLVLESHPGQGTVALVVLPPERTLGPEASEEAPTEQPLRAANRRVRASGADRP